jgi:hypothetical protein
VAITPQEVEVLVELKLLPAAQVRTTEEIETEEASDGKVKPEESTLQTDMSKFETEHLAKKKDQDRE